MQAAQFEIPSFPSAPPTEYVPSPLVFSAHPAAWGNDCWPVSGQRGPSMEVIESLLVHLYSPNDQYRRYTHKLRDAF
jgi:hypothetical protein